MKYRQYNERFERIHRLISRESTGSPSEFARKLQIGTSTLKNYLNEIKEEGISIKYDRFRETYYYDEEEWIIKFGGGFNRVKKSDTNIK